MELDDVTQKMIYNVLAEKIVEAMGGEHRDALLAKAVSDTLKDYSFKRAVEEIICNKATEIAQKLVNTNKVTHQVEDAVNEGIRRYTNALPEAIQLTLTESLAGSHGKSGYPKASILLHHLDKVYELQGTVTKAKKE